MLALQVNHHDAGPAKFRPTIAKTFVKGAIAVGIFSIFLNVNPSTFFNYLIFLLLAFGSLTVVALLKRGTTFELTDDGVIVRRLMRSPRLIRYGDVLAVSISQGVLARRFRCGSVFLVLKSGKGGARRIGGGTAERLEDVPDPARICESVTSRLSFLGQPA